MGVGSYRSDEKPANFLQPSVETAVVHRETRVLKWLQNEFNNVCDNRDVRSLTLVWNPDWLPYQEDDASSAVFVLRVAQILSCGETPNFSQKDVPRLRKCIANSLLRRAVV